MDNKYNEHSQPITERIVENIAKSRAIRVRDKIISNKLLWIIVGVIISKIGDWLYHCLV